MIFGTIEMPQLNKYSLESLNFPRGILVFLLGLVFFLGSTKQEKAMKIGFTFFGAKMDLLCISKVSMHFCVFLIGWKRIYTLVLLTGQGRLRWCLRGAYVATDWTLAWQL